MFEDLAQDITAVLKKMAAKAAGLLATGATMPAVYLAKTTEDVEDEANEIRRDLKDRGFVVLPHGDLPYRVKDLQDKVRDFLSRSVLSIHLVGNEYGFIPEGETERSVAWLQNRLAIERSQDSSFLRLIWMPLDLKPVDSRQQKFVNYLRNDSEAQQGADVLETKIEDLKTVLQEKLRQVRDKSKGARPGPSPSPLPAGDSLEPLRIYLICDQQDLKSEDLIALKKYFFRQNYECILPSEIDDEGEALQEHAENMEICDACLIYYGQGSARWFGAKLRDFRKLLTRRQRPVLAKAVYLALPETGDKKELETHEAIVLRGSSGLTPECLAPFLSRLRPPGSQRPN
jgi:hypothetical protein